MNGKVPHPIPYQGSKRKIAKHIIRFYPKNFERLIEPFAGSAAVSIFTAYSGYQCQFVLNDLNASLMELWDAIIYSPDEIARQYENLWTAQLGHRKQYYYKIRDLFNESPRPDYFLYLLARCVKASVRYNQNCEFNQSADNRRKGRQPGDMRDDILAVSHLLKNRTEICSADYTEVLEKVGQHDLIYMDPPYQGTSTGRDPRYLESLPFQDLMQTLHQLNDRDIQFILSYDGRHGDKEYGKPLPDYLDLIKIEINAGRSTQSTLNGKSVNTYESLYLSPALVDRLQSEDTIVEATADSEEVEQIELVFEEV